ncbi:MAG: hypothetical protein JOS17DRAFT_733471 [Linnemannia elongata]|nr:MAG: hypothetical protein JOS17DRAFT_733471 [Linnemannia elongata]
MILGFWGLTILPDKTYTQIVDNSFKVSMAALDEETKPGRTSLRVSVNSKSQVLCSLIPGSVDQQKLDVAFAEGEEITFSVTGDNIVHLSGNYLPDTGAQDGDEDDYDEEDEDDMYGGYDQDDDGNIVISQGTKRLADLIGDEDEDEDSEDDPDFTGEDDEEDEDDSDDDDDEENSNPNAAQAEGDSEEDEDDEEDDDEENGADDDEDEDDDDEEDDSEDDEVEEPEPVKKEAAPPTKKQKVSEEKTIPVKPKQEATPAKAKAKEEPKKAHKKTLPNGLMIEDTKAGEGARAKSGKKIGMRYIGRLENGKVFDKNTSGKPFSFKLGAGEVIKGWDLGIQGMQLNGERRLTIPPALAYGSQGAPPDIPRNATLVFEVKLVSLK